MRPISKPIHRRRSFNLADLSECESEEAPAAPRERPDEAIMQRIDNESPRERDYGPDGEDGDKEDEIEGEVSPRWGLEGLRDGGKELLCRHRPGLLSAARPGVSWTGLKEWKGRDEDRGSQAPAHTVGQRWGDGGGQSNQFRHCQPHERL